METADTDQTAMEQADATKAQLAATPNTDLYSNGQTKLIKTVNYRFEVANVKKSAEEIEAEIKEVKEALFHYDLSNAEIFSQQISKIEDRKKVLEIKKWVRKKKQL